MLKESAPAEKGEDEAQLTVPDGIEDAHEQDEKMELVLQAVSALLCFSLESFFCDCSVHHD